MQVQQAKAVAQTVCRLMVRGEKHSAFLEYLERQVDGLAGGHFRHIWNITDKKHKFYFRTWLLTENENGEAKSIGSVEQEELVYSTIEAVLNKRKAERDRLKTFEMNLERTNAEVKRLKEQIKDLQASGKSTKSRKKSSEQAAKANCATQTEDDLINEGKVKSSSKAKVSRKAPEEGSREQLSVTITADPEERQEKSQTRRQRTRKVAEVLQETSNGRKATVRVITNDDELLAECRERKDRRKGRETQGTETGRDKRAEQTSSKEPGRNESPTEKQPRNRFVFNVTVSRVVYQTNY